MEVTPTQFLRSVTKDTVDTKEAAAPLSKGNCKNNVQQPSIMRTLVKLSEEQTKGLNFPHGCPVWYNFSQTSCFSGVVQTVHLDIVQKKLVYTVSRKNSHSKSDTNDKFKQSLVLDTVSEENLSYAFNCPVTLTSKSVDAAGGDTSSTKKLDGEVMFSENVSDEMLYVVKLIPSEDDEEGGESHIIRFEDGVKASRLRYREVVAKAVPSKQQQHVKEDCGHTSNVGGEKVPEAVSSSEEEQSLEEKLVVQQRSNQAVNVGDRAVSKEQCSSKKKMQLQKKPQPNKKKAEIKYKSRNNNHHKNSYYGPSTKFPGRNSRDEFGRMPRKKKEGNKSRGGPKKNVGHDHQVQASLEGGASSSQAFKQQKVEKTEKALPIKWEPPAPKQQSCLHYENDGAI